MENRRTTFSKLKSIIDSSDEEDDGSTFNETENKRFSVQTEELLSSKEPNLSILESDSGGDAQLLGKRTKTTHQS